MTELFHYVPTYFKTPTHPVTIALIGVGGNGSRLLIRLAEMHQALIQLDHKGLFVIACDPDTVNEVNIGRQGFYPADIGRNKAEVLISRVNRSFGLNWEFSAQHLSKRPNVNIIVSCVDNVRTRIQIHNWLAELKESNNNFQGDANKSYYWLDLGNSKSNGQVILGTALKIEQPEKAENAVGFLPAVTDIFPDIEEHEDVTAPSCSIAEALQRQDLVINQMMATYAQKIIWSLFKEARLRYQGVFVNLDNLTSNPLLIRQHDKRRKITTREIQPVGKRSKRPSKSNARKRAKKISRRKPARVR